MNTFNTMILFSILATLAAVPGASVMLVVTRSATAGVANGITAATGIVLGDLVYLLLAMLGLGATTRVTEGAVVALRYLGGAYLLGMGIALMRSDESRIPSAPAGRRPGGLPGSLLAGLALTLGDAKAIVFYGSLLPLFVDMGTVRPRDAGIILSVTVVAVGGVKIAYALAADRLVRLAGNVRHGTGMKRMAGIVVAGAGIYTIAGS
ncbi:MAG TPA: LysE family translocator [Gammaproteobacteria bacterium]|nr:LysE family translocator [Gammaproteobacteria bacterium]